MSYFQKLRAPVLGGSVALVALVAGAGIASAATLDQIPGVGAAVNNGIDDAYGDTVTSVAGWYGANLFVTGSDGTATLTAEFFGSEASFANSFTLVGATGGDTAPDTMSTPGGTSPGGVFVDLIDDPTPTAFDTLTLTGVGNGLIDFFFTSSGFSGTVQNGSNPDDANGLAGPNFFATFQPCNSATASFGTCVDLWLDDGGAGDDDNHDDMFVRLSITGGSISIIPVPASIPLLLTGLAGMGLVARRKSKKA